jgi:hypothetical protein
MSTVLDVAGSVLIAVSVFAGGRELQLLARRGAGLRSVAGGAGLRLRGALAGLLFGVILVTVWGGPWTGGAPILFFALAAVVAWNVVVVFLGSRSRRRAS